MNITLGDNIRAIRKERGLTQEQLAEALGVTVGAVHKWERRASMPEIRLLVDMADLFGVSVDALLGYEIRCNSAEEIIDRLKDCVGKKEFDLAAEEAEKALQRYPNNLKLVLECASVFACKGIERRSTAASERAVELLERAVLLLPQNDDPEINEQTIRSEIAVCNISMGNYEKAVEILKKYNVGGVNNADIAMTVSVMEGHDPKDSEECLANAFTMTAAMLIKTISAYINYYIRAGKIKEALQTTEWFIGLIDSMKTDTGAVSYLDRLAAPMLALSASFRLYFGETEQAHKYMQSAAERAAFYDAAPVYNLSAVRFFIGSSEKIVPSDDLGETAANAVERILRSDGRNKPALELWEKLTQPQTQETSGDTTNNTTNG